MISVALCTHNGEKFLCEQLESILNQTVMPDEIVLSDDASTDNTAEVVRNFIAAYSGRMVIRFVENSTALGVTANFERAIRACSHDIIMLSDQDDVWAPDRVERTVEAFDSGPDVQLVHGDARLIDAKGGPLPGSLFSVYGVDRVALTELAGGGAFDVFLRRNLVTGATAAVRRELALAAVPFPAGWIHDEWLAMVASIRGSIVPLEAHLIEYRQHGGNEIGAVQQGFFGKLARITAPGAKRNARLLTRARQLRERYPFVARRINHEQVDAIGEKVSHEEMRNALPILRAARIGPVFREVLTGRYSRFGGGIQDVVRDLIQPLKPER